MLLELTMLVATAFPGQMAAALPSTVADARALEGEGKLAQARDIYERILLLHPADPDAQQGMSSTSEHLALDQRAAGHSDAALDTLVRARMAVRKDKRIMLDLGILEDEMTLYLDAVKVLEELQAMPPVDPNTVYALARTDFDLGRLEVAQEQMQAYLKLRPEDASAHFGMGRIYLQGLQFDKAEAEFKQSIALQPAQSEAHYQLGQVELDQGRLNDAMVQFQKTLERDPQHGGALVGLGTACFKLKQYDKAHEWLLRATEAAPEYQPGHYYLGLTLGRLGDGAASRRELAIATDLAAKDSKQAATRMRILTPDGQP